MTYADRMRAIVLADHERWLAREHDESHYDGSRASIAHGSMDRAYMRGMDMIPQNESNRDYPNMPARLRYSDPTRMAGTSPNVRVIRSDGTSSVVPASSFRRARAATENRYAAVDRQNAQDRRMRRMSQDIGGSQADYD